jgi:ATP-binding cassette subfamily C protein
MFQTLKQLNFLFFQGQKKELVSLVAIITLMALTQVVSIGLIMPFVTLIFNPEPLATSPIIAELYSQLGFKNIQLFTLALGLCVLSILLLGNLFVATSTWLISRYTWRAQTKISTRTLERYLTLPFDEFSQLNTAVIQKNVLFETAQVTTGVLLPVLNIFAFGIVAALIASFLVWINPLVTLTLAATLGCGYLVSYLIVQRPMQRSGTERIAANTERYKAVNEAFGSIKEVKLLELEQAFSDRYTPAATKFSSANTLYTTLSEVPKYAIEAIAFGLLIATLLTLVYQQYDMQSALPIATAFAVGAFRLLPALQKIFHSVSATRFNNAALVALYDAVKNDRGHTSAPKQESQKLTFETAIEVDNISFQHRSAKTNSIDGLSIKIPKNHLVAFVGGTGAGKSTLADIIMGLLSPTKGSVRIDETELNDENVPDWHKNIGFVPQDIYLIDASIRKNIAFGIPEQKIDHNAVIAAAKAANIHNFICNDLQHNYETVVGERGIRLSGGQKQRIGIARALYRNPDVLVMDEATSALDQQTEQEVHKAILEAAKAKTVILIAHRLNTVKQCDCIYLLNNGKLIAEGTYADLINHSTAFKQLASGQIEGQTQI